MLSNGDSNMKSTRAFPPQPGKIADPPTVLLVDDDSVFRGLEARALRERGYNVLQAACAEEALRLAGATATLHLLLTDFNMPDLDGAELARQFRALRPKTPVLLVSGSLPLLQGRLNDLDRVTLLEKSSSFNELLDKVDALLSQAPVAATID
jgi:DNA-binding response OmpR family regulator